MWKSAHAVMCILLAASAAAAERARTTTDHAPVRSLSLHVSAPGDVPPTLLQRAQREVLWIFERASVRVEWISCGLDRRNLDICNSVDAAAIDVAIISNESKAFEVIPPDVLGAVVRGSDSREVGWVFFHRIERAADSFALDTGAVLGHAIAHEVGHVLLPRRSHGPAGLMRASWRMEDMRDAVQGHLGFSATEAAMIRARLAVGN